MTDTAATGTVQTLSTPDGPFTIVADAQGRVLASGWTDQPDAVVARIRHGMRPVGTVPGVTTAADAVRSYYDGDLDAVLQVEVRQDGTAMQRAGWDALRRIAPGRPLTYAEFAAALGSPSAVRAAASICARNAPALFVPCHRVLRTGGALGGFAWGIEVKQRLLAREAA